jgi:hypothetical protein
MFVYFTHVTSVGSSTVHGFRGQLGTTTGEFGNQRVFEVGQTSTFGVFLTQEKVPETERSSLGLEFFQDRRDNLCIKMSKNLQI